MKSAGGVVSVVVVAAILSACGSSGGTEASSPEDQIKAVTADYADAQSAKDEAKLRNSSCKAQVEKEISEFGTEGNPTKVVVDDVKNIKVDGDKGTADVTLTGTFAEGKTDQKSGTFNYVNEDGWKVCLN